MIKKKSFLGECPSCGIKVLKFEIECRKCGFNLKSQRKPNAPSVDRALTQQINDLEKFSFVTFFLIILGLIGLLFYVIPGGLILCLAALNISNRKKNAALLRGQLESLKLSRKHHDIKDNKSNDERSEQSDDEALSILKKRFAQGDIDEKEYLEKKKLLEDQ